MKSAPDHTVRSFPRHDNSRFRHRPRKKLIMTARKKASWFWLTPNVPKMKSSAIDPNDLTASNVAITQLRIASLKRRRSILAGKRCESGKLITVRKKAIGVRRP